MAIPFRTTSVVVGAFVLLIIVSFTVGLSGFGGPDTSDQDLVFDDVVTHDPVTPDPTTSAPPTTTPPVTTTEAEPTTERSASPDTPTTTEEPVTTTERKRSRRSSDDDDSETTTETPATTTDAPVTTTQTPTTTAQPTTTAEPTPTPTPTPEEPTYSTDTESGHYHAYLVTGRPYQYFNKTRDWSYIDNDQVIYMFNGNIVTGDTEAVHNTGWQSEFIRECVDFKSVEVNDTAIRMDFYVHEGCDPDHSWYSLALYEMPDGEYAAPEHPEMKIIWAKARYFSAGHHYIVVDLPEN
ncbi:hypothetical protein [Haladaptatus sp. DJG-WS-42]|uniref:hypothetical protein n=1 Tax=Haladaptatus sp. DJG-WS-42 TaxID=3120516 RepID=UPI0030CB389E